MAMAKLPPGDEFAKGCAYILNRPETLFTYLECFECTPDNNASERQASDVAVGPGQLALLRQCGRCGPWRHLLFDRAERQG